MILSLAVIIYLVVGILIINIISSEDLIDMGDDHGNHNSGEYGVAVLFWPIIVFWVVLKGLGWLARAGWKDKQKRTS